jgi:hypothetical protein
MAQVDVMVLVWVIILADLLLVLLRVIVRADLLDLELVPVQADLLIVDPLCKG